MINHKKKLIVQWGSARAGIQSAIFQNSRSNTVSFRNALLNYASFKGINDIYEEDINSYFGSKNSIDFSSKKSLKQVGKLHSPIGYHIVDLTYAYKTGTDFDLKLDKKYGSIYSRKMSENAEKVVEKLDLDKKLLNYISIKTS